ncbi:hypothetical protein [Paenibacillus sp. FSL H8-0079]|uniref:hypothetical protein n=1 Tax=Paenibacillus sp. FSL H8-0079 TaxID=2921375 RepID=UPI0030EBE122
MAVPATTGQLREKLSDMEIGDYIVWKYDNTINGYIFGGSTTGYTEIPLTGNPLASMPLKYFWYVIKVDRGLLIADRVVNNTITWDWLNSNKFVEGSPRIISETSGIVRSISGGVGYADANGKLSMKDLGLGAFPNNNEYDKYIMKSSLGGKATPNDDNVWHHHNVFCWAKETPVLGSWTTNKGTALTANSTSRIVRGFESRDDNRGVAFTGGSASQNYIGFRPAFEYKEV